MPVLSAGGLLAGAAYVGFLDPSRRTIVPPCPFHAMTGLWCPVCGATRAAHQVLSGHVMGAAGYNLLFTIAVPFLAYAWVAWALQRLRGRPVLPLLRLPRWSTPAILVVLGVFMVARNIPGWPGAALAP